MSDDYILLFLFALGGFALIAVSAVIYALLDYFFDYDGKDIF